MQKHIILGTSLTLLAALITGCEINEDVNPNPNFVPQTTQVTITPSLGKILNAKVVLKNAKTGAMLGEGKTDGTTGIAKFTAQKTTDPVVIEVQGVDGAQGATYYDEASDSNVALPSTQKIRAIAPNLANNANIGVTVLTELAVQAAEKTLGGSLSTLTAQVANDANNQIKALLAKELGANSLLTPPTIVGKDTIVKDVITAQNAANDYALKLAALAKLGTGNTPVLDMLQKLSDDISDNRLDGKKDATAINYATGESNDTIFVSLQSFIQDYINATQIDTTIYTQQILNGFNVLEGGEIKISIAISGFGVGNTLTAANLAKLAGNYSGSGELVTTSPESNKEVSCSASISAEGTMSATGGGLSVSLVPNALSVISNITVNQQTFKSVTLIEGGLGGVATATAVFDTNDKPYSVNITKTVVNIQNPTASSTTSLLCSFVQN